MVPRSSLKGGKNGLMVEKRTRKPNTTQNRQPKAHRPSLHHHAVFPMCQVKRVKRKRASRNGPEFTNEKHIGAGLCSSKVTKKAPKGLYFTIASDQRPHHGAAKSWSRCRSGVSQCSNVGCIHVKWSSVAMQHAVEKTFLVAQPVQQVALTSPVACYQAVINQWRPQHTTKACR